jgi:hypothetical protein
VPLPIADSVTIDIAGSGRITVDGEAPAPDALLERLFAEANRKRDLDHPMQPSEWSLVLRADPAAPWRAVRAVTEVAAHPDVRLYRIYWAAVREGVEVGLPMFLPKDRGLARTKIRVIEPPRLHILLAREEGAGRKTVDYPFNAVGTDEAGLRRLSEDVSKWLDRVPKLQVEVDPEDDVPIGDLVRTLDHVPNPGGWNLPPINGLTELAFALAPIEAAPKLLRAALADVTTAKPPEDLLDDAEGLTPAFASFLDEHLAPGVQVSLFERIAVPNPEDRPRFRALLANTSLPRGALLGIAERGRLDPRILVGLARALLATRDGTDALGAATLAALVTKGTPRDRYTKGWWYREVLLLRGLVGYAEERHNGSAVDLALSRFEIWEKLGGLDRSPYASELRELRKRAQSLK